MEEKLGYQSHSKKSFEKADELVGYKPNQDQEDALPKIGTEEKKPIQPIAKEEEKLTLSYFFKTLKSVIVDEKARKEFITFLKKPFQ